MRLIWYVFLCIFVSKRIKGEFRLQILHVNDVHSRFLETDVHGAPCSWEYASEKKCYGGFGRMKKAVDRATVEAAKADVASVFLNAGDNFQGTVYYTMYKWQVVADLTSKMDFDAVALGNHEFDNGVENLANYVKNLHAPVVCCNLNLTAERRLQLPNLTPSVVLRINQTKIGVIGYLTTETMGKSQTERVAVLDEISSIRAEAKRLKANGVDIIIALGHCGFEMDTRIAEQVEEISVVVGGHSHSLLYTPKDRPPSTEQVTSVYPTMVRQASGKQVPVVQAYAYTKYLGKLLLRFNENGDVIEATGNTQLLDASIQKDTRIESEVLEWSRKMGGEIKQIRGYTRVFLAKCDFQTGQLESNLANLVTDAFLDQGVRNAMADQLDSWTRASIAIYTNGGINSAIDNKKNDGAITMEDLFNVLPYENQIIEISLYGKDVKKILEISVSTYNPLSEHRYIAGFLQFSGMRVTYDLSQPVGSRVQSVDVLCTYCDVPKFERLREENIYNVITIDYWLEKIKAYEPVKDSFITKTVLGLKDIDVLVKYIERNSIVYPKLDDRITVIGFEAANVNSSSWRLALSKYLFWAVILRMFC